MFFLFILFVAGALFYVALTSYNKLQNLAQNIREHQSNTQVVISKKLELIGKLQEVVSSYQQFEQFTVLKVSQDNSPQGMVAAYQQSGAVLTTLQGVAEKFPELKTNQQYNRLVDNIESCEYEIQEQRVNYNAAVRGYNSVCLSIPTVFVAKHIGFTSAPYLEFDHSGMVDVTSLKEFKTDDGERLQMLLGNAGQKIAGATRSIASQATQASMTLTDKIKEASSKGDAGTQYFYRTPPDGVPAGPADLQTIRNKIAQGELLVELLVAEVGSNQWLPVSEFLADTSAQA